MSHNIKKTLDKHWITVQPFTPAGWLTRAGTWLHTHSLTFQHAWNREPQSNRMSSGRVRVCWRFHWPAAQRLVFQLLRLEEPFPNPQKAFVHQTSAAIRRRTLLHTENATRTTTAMTQSKWRIRDYTRPPKSVCSSAEMRDSFLETSLSWSRTTVQMIAWHLSKLPAAHRKVGGSSPPGDHAVALAAAGIFPERCQSARQQGKWALPPQKCMHSNGLKCWYSNWHCDYYYSLLFRKH